MDLVFLSNSLDMFLSYSIQLLEYPITTTTTPAAPARHKKRQVAISRETSVVS